MADSSDFLPQWTTPPGSTIADSLAARRVSHTQFAEQLGQSAEFVQRLLSGREAITIGLARQLQQFVGGSAAFWMMRDRQYREDVARLREAGLSWLQELPLNDMSRLGWIAEESPAGFEVETLLRYFDVPSVPIWRVNYAAMLEAAAFRTSRAFSSNVAAVAAWFREGQRLAESISCQPWNPEALQRALLGELRALTRLADPQRFIPRLRTIAAACGVAVVLVPAPTGCRASGALTWLSENKALVLLSARYLTDDHLWFTFYHECGHLLLHRDAQLFLDEDEDQVATASAVEEGEANSFAVEMLIPREYKHALRLVRLNTVDVVRLASEIGVSPGILVGQLQKMGRLGPERLNGLKRRYQWVRDRLIKR